MIPPNLPRTSFSVHGLSSARLLSLLIFSFFQIHSTPIHSVLPDTLLFYILSLLSIVHFYSLIVLPPLLLLPPNLTLPASVPRLTAPEPPPIARTPIGRLGPPP